MNCKEIEYETGADEQSRVSTCSCWSPFKHYGECDDAIDRLFVEQIGLESQQKGYVPKSFEQASQIVKQMFPDTCKNCCCERQRNLRQSGLSHDHKPQYILPPTNFNNDNGLLFRKETSQTLWKSLLRSCYKKPKVKHKNNQWRKDYMRHLQHYFEQVAYDGVLLGNEDSENTDESSTEDEMSKDLSSYEFLMNNINGFYISEHGLAFKSKDEVDDFDSKMADMEAVLQAELLFIQHQHIELQARRGEERKLLSQKTESIESEEEQESTEYQKLNKDSKDKTTNPERKSTFLETLHSAIIKTSWLQGFLDKKTPQGAEIDDSDNEQSKETMADLEGMPAYYDNHDEFTRQMEEEGGLKYKGQDKTVKQLAYDELPPPLSIGRLQQAPQSNS